MGVGGRIPQDQALTMSLPRRKRMRPEEELAQMQKAFKAVRIEAFHFGLLCHRLAEALRGQGDRQAALAAYEAAFKKEVQS